MVDREKLNGGYVLLLIFDLSDGMKAVETAINIASSRRLDLVVMYPFKNRMVEEMVTPSIRKGVGDHTTLIYSFSDISYYDELRKVNHFLEKIKDMADERNVKVKSIHEVGDLLPWLIKESRKAECIIIGYTQKSYDRIVNKIRNLVEKPVIIVK